MNEAPTQLSGENISHVGCQLEKLSFPRRTLVRTRELSDHQKVPHIMFLGLQCGATLDDQVQLTFTLGALHFLLTLGPTVDSRSVIEILLLKRVPPVPYLVLRVYLGKVS